MSYKEVLHVIIFVTLVLFPYKVSDETLDNIPIFGHFL
jgi:hypothetical protein